ncbi:MAG: aminotransferase class V-fold PLP-dependent enzyme [Bryobacterales bacterium]|nr:aminotransferase class V-fold PLP-dependent enzyme [Bryobacterales bacterium]
MTDYKSLFPQAVRMAYLDTGAEGLPVPRAEDALRQYFKDKSLGTPGRRCLHAAEAETLELAARLLGTQKASVALLSSASEALNVLPHSIDWREGDEAIVTDLEFPSNVLACLRLKQAGVKVLIVPGDRGAFDWEEMAERLSPRTRLVSVSLVSYKTGAYFTDLPKLAAEAHRVGAIVSVDATQALGRCPVSLDGVDFLMSSSFKWLLGPHGLGLTYVAPDLGARLNPASVGWYSVPNCFAPDRFERYDLKPGAARLSIGMPNFGSIYALRESLKFILEAGVAGIYADLAPLVAEARRELLALGLEVLTPEAPAAASGIVSFAHPKAGEIGAALEEQGVIVWAGDGRVRCSIHLYNDAADVDRYLDRLRAVLAHV